MRIIVFLLLVCPLMLRAQMPMGMSFQSVVRDQDNTLLADQRLNGRIDILRIAGSEDLLYSELHEFTTNTNGLAYLVIGQGIAETGMLSDIDWRQGPIFVRFYAESPSSGNYYLTEEMELATLPYAFHTAVADSIFGFSLGIPPGSAQGDLLFWKDGAWSVLPVGEKDSYLTFSPEGQLTWESREDVVSENAYINSIQAEIDMVAIEGGSFNMGCEAGANPGEICSLDEFPVREVEIGSFSLGKTEVTQRLWTLIMGFNPSSAICNDCPVTDISWYDTQVFINRLNRLTGKNYRLPTESEWEYAARKGSTGNLDATAVYAGNSGSVQEVATKTPDNSQVYDLQGNVWEWVADWYQANYYSKQISDNPEGPLRGIRKTYRGCAFDSSLANCLVSNRESAEPDTRKRNVGFRLAGSAN